MARILIVGKFYPPCRGGTEAYTLDVAEALAERHDVTTLVFNHEPGSRTERRRGVRVVRCGVTTVLKSQPVSFDYLRRLRLRNFDLVHFQAPNLLATAALLVQLFVSRRDVPVIITHHSDVLGRRVLRALLMPLYFRLARRARHVVVTSMKNARLSNDLPGDAKIAVVPLGVDPAHYLLGAELKAEAAAWRNTLCGDAPTVSFIGRHARYKGLDVLIRAIALMPGVHALIAGDGPYRSVAEELSAQLGLNDRVHFLGSIDEATKLLVFAASDVFAFPSTEVTEAFGISQLEAMAAGVAVVASNLPTGVTDIAIHDCTALLVPPMDEAALAAAVGRLVANVGLRERLANKALANVHHEFSKAASMASICTLVDRNLS